MKVQIYVTTTLAGPAVKDGNYGAVVEYITPKGHKEIRTVTGFEQNTTWHRSVILATVKALNILTVPCSVEVYTTSNFVTNTLNSGNVENGNMKQLIIKPGIAWRYVSFTGRLLRKN